MSVGARAGLVQGLHRRESVAMRWLTFLALLIGGTYILRYGVLTTWRNDPRSAFVRHPVTPPSWYPFGATGWRIQARGILFSALLTLIAILGAFVYAVVGYSPSFAHFVLFPAITVALVGMVIVGVSGRPRVLVPPLSRGQHGDP